MLHTLLHNAHIITKWRNRYYKMPQNSEMRAAYIGKFTAMITLHFHLLPQYKYELFHINFTSFRCTGRYELNKLASLPTCDFIVQLVEHSIGIAEVTGSNPSEALIFIQASSFQLFTLENLLR